MLFVLYPERLKVLTTRRIPTAKNYQLIDGIYDELAMAENQRKGLKTEWKRS